MNENERKLAKALTRLVAEIEEMAVRRPVSLPFDDERDDANWFGGFSVGGDVTHATGATQTYIAWPNLRLLVEEFRPLIDENDVIGG